MKLPPAVGKKWSGAHWEMLAVTAVLFVLVAVFVGKFLLFHERSRLRAIEKDRPTLSITAAVNSCDLIKRYFRAAISGADPEANSGSRRSSGRDRSEKSHPWSKKFSGRNRESLLEPVAHRERSKVKQPDRFHDRRRHDEARDSPRENRARIRRTRFSYSHGGHALCR